MISRNLIQSENNTNSFYSQPLSNFEVPLPSDAFNDKTESNFQNASKKISKCTQEDSKKINRKKHNRARNPWTAAEDQKVFDLMKKHGQNWAMISAGMEGRTGKQIRDRFLNKLNPEIKKCGDWTQTEDDIMMRLINEVGNRWSLIASHLPGRTEGQVKNRYYSSMKKKLETNGVVSHTSGVSTVSETISNLPTSPCQDEGLKLDFGLNFDANMTLNLESEMNTARNCASKKTFIFEDAYLKDYNTQDLFSESECSFKPNEAPQADLSLYPNENNCQFEILEKVINHFDTNPTAVSDVDMYFSDNLNSHMNFSFGMETGSNDKHAILTKRKAYLELALAKTLKEMKGF